MNTSSSRSPDTDRRSRREFLGRATLLPAAFAALTPVRPAQAASAKTLHLSCNQYVWQVFYQRDGKKLEEHLDQALGEMVAAGINGFEPTFNSVREVETLAPLVKRHGLQLRSFYVNSTLHDSAQVERSIHDILTVARAARAVGTEIVVTNPSPLRWGGPENKDDRQLACQAEAMNRLGRELRRLGLRLAYHNHDIELRQAAREFHHMMLGTDAANVHLCLDAHWVYRGSGNSSIALFDVVGLYAKRVVELHLRQSVNQVWTEALGDGDIDYRRLARELHKAGVRPLLVLEQAIESASPRQLDVVEAHRRTCAYVRDVFGNQGE